MLSVNPRCYIHAGKVKILSIKLLNMNIFGTFTVCLEPTVWIHTLFLQSVCAQYNRVVYYVRYATAAYGWKIDYHNNALRGIATSLGRMW